MIEDSKRDVLAEIGWAMLTLALGAVPSAGPAVWKAYSTKPPTAMAATDMIQVVMLVVGLVGATFAFAVVLTRGNKAGGVIAEIKKQKP